MSSRTPPRTRGPSDAPTPRYIQFQSVTKTSGFLKKPISSRTRVSESSRHNLVSVTEFINIYEIIPTVTEDEAGDAGEEAFIGSLVPKRFWHVMPF